ncbi:vascular cell adhesion protein 1-like [Strongylocentrotus purpuratus]|uniref:Ig-like domain-containing protein n=1 Tax=Strongylocentrotus purpuratus TaxID=7668 RepID=A0A7M7NCR8_STRPU|nr:vascular cell adhesion protein 1-like [Strongylocentrotus purpuratus]
MERLSVVWPRIGSWRMGFNLPPSDLQLTAYRSITTNTTETRSVNVFEYSITSFTCKSVGSRPTALISWNIGSDDDLGSTTTTSTTNEADQGLRDTQSTLQLIPKRKHHNKLLRCVAYAGMNQRQTEVRLIVYDSPYLNGTEGLQAGVSSNVICTSNNGYPAPTFRWYLGSKNVTKDSKTQFSRNRTLLRDASSVFNFTPTVDEHGKLLVCLTFQLNAASMEAWSVSEVLHVLYSPVIVDYSVRRVSSGQKSVAAVLTCTSDSRPLASITWFLNGKELINDTRHHIRHSHSQEDTLRKSRSTLLVYRLSKPDDISYSLRCLATWNP